MNVRVEKVPARSDALRNPPSTPSQDAELGEVFAKCSSITHDGDGSGQSHCSLARELTGCGLPMTARATKKLIWPIAMVRVASALSS